MALFADLPEALATPSKSPAAAPFARKCAPRSCRISRKGRPTARKAVEEAETPSSAARRAKGLNERLRSSAHAEGSTEEDYRNRLEFELNVISSMKFSGYFLIVSDFIKWAKAHGIPVGPGRGSGAGSVAAWALSITDLDPLRFGLLFERFLNPERVSMPDFDIDFCQDRRDEVIRYVQEKYGAGRVAQIITFGKLQARAVLRDVGRVLQMPYGQVDRLCKLVPNNPANPVTLAEAIEGEQKLQQERDSDPVVKQLLEIAQKLEGLYRHASTHAAGVVIGDRKLSELVPLYRDPRSTLPVTQFNMKWVEPAGLVKFDFLGLKTLTVIQKALALMAQRGVDWISPGWSWTTRKPTSSCRAATRSACSSWKSTGMRESLRKLKPDRFGDIIAMVSLYRPGPMDNIPNYINRKYGLEDVDYLHPLIAPVLEETYGVIIYQEQVMQIAQRLSSYSLGEADLLRRAMGKKIKAEMDQQKARFMEGATRNGVDKGRADYIFELVAKFAGYGFNKSHAAAYALLAYQTAYLKANYPVEFLAATMTYDMANTDKLYLFAQEARRQDRHAAAFGQRIGRGFPARGRRDPLCAVGAEEFRARRGGAHHRRPRDRRRISPPSPTSPSGSTRKCSTSARWRRWRRRACSTRWRRTAPASTPISSDILSYSGRLADDRATGQNDLFAGGAVTVATPQLQLREVANWDLIETLSHELDAIGFYLSGHPLDDYADALTRLNVMRWSELEAKLQTQSSAEARLAATVTYKQERRSKSGNRFAFGGFSDPTGQFEAVIFSDTLALAGDSLEPGKAVLLVVEAELDGENVKTRVKSVQDLDAALGRSRSGLCIVADGRLSVESLVKTVGGGGATALKLRLRLADPAREVELNLGGNFDVTPRQAGALKALPGVLEVVAF